MKFNELNLREEILRSAERMGYEEASPIQEKAIPAILDKKDIIGLAQTGTGKTAAFAMPILDIISKTRKAQKRTIRALILCPTRELAVQIFENFESYGRFLNLRSMVIFGGVDKRNQIVKIKKGVDIVIATPGRINDLYDSKLINFNDVEILVLDEADRMLDMGFIVEVQKIIRAIPAERQSLMFSATMSHEINQFANTFLTDPVKIEVAPENSTVDSVSQIVYHVDRTNKPQLLRHILKEKNIEQALVFVKTKHGADRLVRELVNSQISALAIHGDKSQNARQDALRDFKKGKVRILVATDIAARGIDISELPYVFNYEIPNEPETYVHRIGRTGRAGTTGQSISFANFDELDYILEIQKLISKVIPVAEDNPLPMSIFEAMPTKTQRGRKPPFPNGKKTYEKKSKFQKEHIKKSEKFDKFDNDKNKKFTKNKSKPKSNKNKSFKDNF